MNTLYIVGFGSGSQEHMTIKALKVLEQAELIVGYTSYVEMMKEVFPSQTFLTTPMRKEEERCLLAIEEVQKGKNVALVSSGDSGIYGMAGIALQLVQEKKADITVEVVSGVTAASMASAVLGAPLMHDFAVISLSDLMTPWEKIEKRIECAAMGDLITCFYNPRSKKRNDSIKKAAELMLKWQSESIPVGIVRHAGRKEQESKIVDLGYLSRLEQWSLDEQKMLDMFSIVIVGNGSTYVKDGKMITPRGYEKKEGFQRKNE